MLEAIKQSFLSCYEVEEKNYLKEEGKAGILQALLSVLDFRNLNNSCNFSKITLDCWKHPFFSALFFSFIYLFSHIQVQWAQAIVHSPTYRLVGQRWWWAVAWWGMCYTGTAREEIARHQILIYLLMDTLLLYLTVVSSFWAYPVCSKSCVLNLWHFTEF